MFPDPSEVSSETKQSHCNDNQSRDSTVSSSERSMRIEQLRARQEHLRQANHRKIVESRKKLVNTFDDDVAVPIAATEESDLNSTSNLQNESQQSSSVSGSAVMVAPLKPLQLQDSASVREDSPSTEKQTQYDDLQTRVQDLEAVNDALRKQTEALLEYKRLQDSSAPSVTKHHRQDDVSTLNSLSSDSQCRVPQPKVHEELQSAQQLNMNLKEMVRDLHEQLQEAQSSAIQWKLGHQSLQDRLNHINKQADSLGAGLQEELQASSSTLDLQTNREVRAMSLAAMSSLEIDADASTVASSHPVESKAVDLKSDEKRVQSRDTLSAPSDEKSNRTQALFEKVRMYETIIEQNALSHLLVNELEIDNTAPSVDSIDDEASKQSSEAAVGYEEVQSTLEAATGELDRMRDSLDVNAKELDGARELNQSLETQNESLQQEMEEMTKNVREMESKMLGQQLLGEAKAAEFEELRSKYDSDLVGWEDQRVQLAEQLLKTTESANANKLRFQETATKMIEVQQEMEKATKLREDMVVDLEELEQQVELGFKGEEEDSLARKRGSISLAATQLVETRARVVELQSTIDVLQIESKEHAEKKEGYVMELEQDKDKLSEQVNHLTAINKELEMRCDSVTQELDESMNQVDRTLLNAKSREESFASTKERMLAQIDALEKEKAYLSSRLGAVEEGESAMIRNKTEEQDKALQVMAEDLAEMVVLRDEKLSLEEETRDLRDKNSILEESLGSVVRELAEAESRVCGKQNEVVAAVESLNIEQSKASYLDERSQEVLQENKELQTTVEELKMEVAQLSEGERAVTGPSELDSTEQEILTKELASYKHRLQEERSSLSCVSTELHNAMAREQQLREDLAAHLQQSRGLPGSSDSTDDEESSEQRRRDLKARKGPSLIDGEPVPLSPEIQTLHQAKDDLQDLLRESDEQLSIMRTKNEDLLVEVTVLTDKITGLETAAIKSQEEVASVSEKLQCVTACRDELQAQIRTATEQHNATVEQLRLTNDELEQSTRDLQSLLSKSETNVMTMETTNNALMTEMSQLKNTVVGLEATHTKSQGEVVSFGEQLRIVSEERDELHQKLKSVDEEAAGVAKQLESTKVELNQLLAVRNTDQSKYEEASKGLTMQSKTLEATSARVAEAIAEKESLHEKLVQTEETLFDCKDMLIASEEQLVAALEQSEGMMTRIEQLQSTGMDNKNLLAEQEQAVLQLREEKRILESKIGDIEGSHDENEKARQSTADQLAEAEKEKIELTNSLEQTRKELNEFASKFTQSLNTARKADVDSTDLEAANTRLKSHVTSLHLQNESMQRASKESQEALNLVQVKLNEMEEKNITLEGQVSESKTSLRSMKAEENEKSAQLQTKYDEMMQKFTSLTASFTDLTILHEALSVGAEGTSELMTKLENENAGLVVINKGTTAQLKQEKEEIARVSQQLSEAKKQNDSLTVAIAEWKGRLETSQLELSKRQDVINASSPVIEQLGGVQEQLATSKAEMGDLRKAYNDLEGVNNKLTEEIAEIKDNNVVHSKKDKSIALLEIKAIEEKLGETMKAAEDHHRRGNIFQNVIANLNQANAKLEETNKALGDENVFLRRENENFAVAISTQPVVEETRQAPGLVESKSDDTEAAKENAFLRSQRVKYLRSISELETKLDILSLERSKYHDVIVAAEREIEKVDIENRALQKCRMEVDVRSSEKLEAAVEKGRWLSHELGKSQDTIVGLTVQSDEMRQKIEKQQEEARESEKQMESDIQVLRGRLEQQKQELQELEQDLLLGRGEAHRVVHNLRTELRDLAKSNHQLKVDRVSLEEQREALGKQLTQQAKSLRTLLRQRESLVLDEGSKSPRVVVAGQAAVSAMGKRVVGGPPRFWQ